MFEINLRVVRLLADLHGQGACTRDLSRQLACRRGQFLRGNRVVNQPPLRGGASVDRLAGEEHLERALAADCPAELHHGRGAEEADFDAWCRELRLFCRNRQVACCNQLASGRRRHALHLGNHRLRNGMQLHHQLRTQVKNFPVIGHRPAHHLAQVMAGGKHLSLGRQNRRLHTAVAPYLAQTGDQLAHQTERKRVSPLWAVQRYHRNIVLSRHLQGLICHDLVPQYDNTGVSLSPNERIRVLITGGTFDKEYDEINGRLFFKDSHLAEMLSLGRCRLPVELRTLMMVDSLDMTDADRNLIVEQCRAIPEARIVITHGTDTMAETARVLASSIESKTIVLTGAMIPYKFGSSDGLFNLGSALAFVQTLPPGVYLVMNGRCFDAGRVRKNRQTGIFEETIEEG